MRPYQVEALAAIAGQVRAGKRRLLVALPTGTGKTVIFAGALPFLRAGRRALVIAHREELLDQAAGAIRLAHPDWTVDVEQADREASPGADVIVASIQTLTAAGGRRLRALDPQAFGAIVIDEAHHVTARSYVEALSWFRLCPPPSEVICDEWDEMSKRAKREVTALAFGKWDVPPSAPTLLGVTATPNRADGHGLEYVFDEIAYSRTIREMIEDGWLVAVRGVRVPTGASLDRVSVRGGDFAEGALAASIDTPERNAIAVRAYLDHAADRQCLAFTSTVAHAEHLAETFRQAGVPAVHVSGVTPSDERHAIIADFKSGRTRVVANCAVLTEGFDAPATSAILMARPTKSATLYTQMLGRGTRLSGGKDDLVVIDLVDGYSRAGIANLNVLFGLPPKFDTAGGDVLGTVCQLELEGIMADVPAEALAEVTTFEEARRVAQSIDPLAMAELDPFVKQVATLRWVKVAWGYGLSLQDCSLGVVVDLLGQATVRIKYPNEFPVTLGRYPHPATGIEAAEAWVRDHEPDALVLVRKKAAWHSDAPTEAQLTYAARLKVVLPPGATRGRVSALISAAKAKRSAGMWQRGM